MLRHYYIKFSSTTVNRLALYRCLSSEGCCKVQRQKPSSLADERPDLNFDYLLDSENIQEIEQNIKNRKGIGNIRKIHEIWNSIESFKHNSDQCSAEFSMNEYKDLWRELYDEALLIPNKSDPEVPIGDESHAKVVTENSGPQLKTEKPKTAEDIVKGWRAISYARRSAGSRSYTLIGPTANLQTALFSFAKDIVREKGFEEIEVSDILPKKITQGCGVNVRTDAASHAIQYEVTDFPKMCLSGTAEMGIADKLANRTFKESELPKLFLAESRCFRPEISKSASEAKLYRVHEFNKLEMFAVCTPTQSSKILQMFLEIQIDIWSKLGVKYRVLDMPSEELGAPASRKYDIEAWMPGRGIYGEVSSTSNCTDYQARRLGIKYQDNSGEECFVHTCNGTAMASTRALITVLETFQTARGFNPPEILKKYLPNDRNRDKLKMAPVH
uniref:Serine--tRNA ligase n=1 Tax=Panagrolaimus sp. PS1159 TaxID=55785 RepID=A0AC35GXF8_9BILA